MHGGLSGQSLRQVSLYMVRYSSQAVVHVGSTLTANILPECTYICIYVRDLSGYLCVCLPFEHSHTPQVIVRDGMYLRTAVSAVYGSCTITL